MTVTPLHYLRYLAELYQRHRNFYNMEHKVKTYKRRTKTGKIVTVKAHTRKGKDGVKQNGAGEELKSKKQKVEKIPNLIYEDPNWVEFENNFEEGWWGEPSVKRLAITSHHRKVANLAAYNLSKKYASQDVLYQKKNWETIAQKAYDSAAKKLYPKEKLWSGDIVYSPEFPRTEIGRDPRTKQNLKDARK